MFKIKEKNKICRKYSQDIWGNLIKKKKIKKYNLKSIRKRIMSPWCRHATISSWAECVSNTACWPYSDLLLMHERMSDNSEQDAKTAMSGEYMIRVPLQYAFKTCARIAQRWLLSRDVAPSTSTARLEVNVRVRTVATSFAERWMETGLLRYCVHICIVA